MLRYGAAACDCGTALQGDGAVRRSTRIAEAIRYGVTRREAAEREPTSARLDANRARQQRGERCATRPPAPRITSRAD
ncbi:hypothetical protein AQ802_05995 [Burkholderia pseudomallei]|nr:hypothetical protein UQ47_21585 [Burkholderia pseudomallei]ALB96329.1 hypothetical protein AM256_21990 [Burkholderia pseudomallei]ALC02381.1 hypothetical protein AM257_22015 [Burkholderia pseudomallei]ALC60997.1 hypothetical protein AMS56_30390 [Burkholderia pseudomallei]KYZ80096.1 hypothetical protein PTBPS01_27950 [Burkholderia pseudomallei]